MEFNKLTIKVLLTLAVVAGCKPNQHEHANKVLMARMGQPNGIVDMQQEHSLSLKIAYIGNMGVLLESDGKTVIIDGLHEPDEPDYLQPSKAMVKDLTKGKFKGFTPIELSLVTHAHKDHFSASYMADLLSRNPKAMLIGPEQAKNGMSKSPVGQTVINQMVTVAYDGQVQEIDHGGVSVKATRCDHASQLKHGDVQNIAYLVKMMDYTVLHVGETYWGVSDSAFNKLDLKGQSLDVAILPYWMLQEPRSKGLAKLGKNSNP